ncbi:dihydropteroate synthase [Acetobacter estunensis NRIC 0472]|uniref:dihydropteroate synthase n=1 Tax=Acetobacter estunensis TaxID=104097 RepID=A0A967B8S6_9PROT|nr:dihydropteroate synthase [Acetobacter estunensis]NHO54988.1 dihydropteroate synthase [Acetobacter estunensis]GBQ27855.1 dihydropteroate synthase [Acetobacter estunensis NRIC 0472]
MNDLRLVEPAGLLRGAGAAEAITAGVALPLAGGKTAFSVVSLIERDGTKSAPRPVDRIPASWLPELEVVTAPSSLAGLPSGAMVMGILNVTPDSFSDGDQHRTPERIVARAQQMQQAGVAILDVGAESTRPGAAVVSPSEEWSRLEPVLAELMGRGIPVSVDTRNARTMEAALNMGAMLINDVSALAHDPEALPLLARRSCPVVLMHMRGTPKTMNALTDYRDVAVDVVQELHDRIAQAEQAGIERSRILIDPGIGFAKTAEQNAELLRRLPILANLGCRVVLGTSRKRMIGTWAGVAEPTARDPGTIVTSLPGLDLPGTLLRVHDGAGMVQAMRVWEAMAGNAVQMM